MPRSIFRLALLTLALSPVWLGIGVDHTAAQTSQPTTPDAEADALLAGQFVVMMNRVLAGEHSPRPDQLTRAHMLLDQALALHVDDAELWHLRAELARRMDDDDAYRKAMAHYMRLRPDDDVAQLERLLAGLGQQQTLDDRLARLEAILQARSAQQLSAPLRSRLATRAALAAQELGDEAKLDRWLTEAVRLDPANPDAAELAYALARRNDSPPAVQGATLVNLIQASPADPIARLRLARWLTTQTAYDLARQQFDAAATLAAGPLPADVYAYRVIALAASGHADQARALLDEVAPLPSDDGNENAVGIDADAYPTIRLSLELLRLALIENDANADAVQRSFARVEALTEANARADESPDDADAASDTDEGGRRLMLAWMAAVFNHQLDNVPELLADLPADAPLARRARGWMHLHRGEPAEAAEQFQPITDVDPLAALGLARLLEADTTEQTDALQAVVRRDGGGLAGLLAARQLLAQGQRVQPTAAAREVRKQMDRAPFQLWQPALNVSPWITMHLRIAPNGVGYLDPLYATIELRNTSRMPLPFGDGRGVPERALISPALSVGGQPLARPGPTVVDVHRRLTLAPGETLRITTRLDRSQLGAMMFAVPTRTLSLSALAVLGPRATPAGGVTAEPVGGVDSVRAITIRGTPITADRLDDWLADLDADQPIARLQATARLLRSVDHLPDDLNTAETRRRIADAITQRFAEWDVLSQAWAVRFVTQRDDHRDLFRRILDHAERSDEPTVRLVFLATHADDDAAALNAALRHDNPTIRRYAEALRDAAEAASASEDDDAS